MRFDKPETRLSHLVHVRFPIVIRETLKLPTSYPEYGRCLRVERPSGRPHKATVCTLVKHSYASHYYLREPFYRSRYENSSNSLGARSPSAWTTTNPTSEVDGAYLRVFIPSNYELPSEHETDVAAKRVEA
jgi:hypothetical protein